MLLFQAESAADTCSYIVLIAFWFFIYLTIVCWLVGISFFSVLLCTLVAMLVCDGIRIAYNWKPFNRSFDAFFLTLDILFPLFSISEMHCCYFLLMLLSLVSVSLCCFSFSCHFKSAVCFLFSIQLFSIDQFNFVSLRLL